MSEPRVCQRRLVNEFGTKWDESSSDVPCRLFGARTQSEEMPWQHYDQHQKYSTGPNKVKTPDSVAGGYSKATQGVAKPRTSKNATEPCAIMAGVGRARSIRPNALLEIRGHADDQERPTSQAQRVQSRLDTFTLPTQIQPGGLHPGRTCDGTSGKALL